MSYRIDHTPPEDHQGEPRDTTGRYILAQVSRWQRTSDPVHPRIAMAIAAQWHSPAPRDVAITAFASHGEVMLWDLESALRRIRTEASKSLPDRYDMLSLEALLDYVGQVVRDATRYMTHLSSGRGHQMLGTDDPRHESCLTCGGMWGLAPDLAYEPDGSIGSYFAGNGDYADECSGDTSRAHGYERVCQGGTGSGCDVALTSEDGLCPCVDHTCNCLFCQ